MSPENTTRSRRTHRNRTKLRNFRHFGPGLESLEDRRLLAGVTVGNALDLVNAPDTSSISALLANDGGDGISLREAVLAANSGAGVDTIDFDPSLTGQTIRLTAGELLINSDVSIVGLGAGNLTISGDADGSGTHTVGDSRVINITAGTVNINDLTIADGFHYAPYADSVAESDGGGGMHIAAGANVSLTDVTVTGNRANSLGGSYLGGGGIFNQGTLTLTRANVTDNYGFRFGAGLLSSGTLTAYDSNFTGNEIDHNIGNGAGGGIAVYGPGTAYLKGLNISSNRRAQVGIGLVSYGGGNVELVDSVVSLHEFGQSGSGNGAGVAAAGGGTLTLRGVQLQGNRAWEYGGGLYVDPSSTARVYNSTFANNDSSESGGAIFNAGSLSLTNTTLYDNDAFDEGGGIYNRSGATAEIRHSTITGNEAVGTDQDFGGGVYNQTGGTLTLANSIVAGNYSEGDSATHDVGGAGVTTFDGVNIFATPGTGDAQDLIETDLSNIFDAVITFTVPTFQAGALANNGGPVPTVLINTTGLAVGNGFNSAIPADVGDVDGDSNTAEPLPVDARGLPRLFELTVDIGAVERQVGTLPRLVSMLRLNPVGEATTADTLLFRATFDENVLNVTPDDFVITGTTATATVTPVNDFIYDVTVSGGDLANLTGRVGIDLAAGQNIVAMDNAEALPTAEPIFDETYALGLLITTTVDEAHNAGDIASEGNDGAGLSLREATALIEAGQSSGLNEIKFDASLTGSTIRLTAGELLINSDVSIVGLGAGNLTISGDADGSGTHTVGDSRVINITAGTVNINDLTIADGFHYAPYADSVAESDGGGGMHIAAGANVSLTDVTVTGNRANSLGGSYLGGGGIFNQGTLTLTRANVTDNYGFRFGAGLLSSGTLTAYDSNFTGNEIDHNIGNGAGGGIAVYGPGTAYLKGLNISSNRRAQVGIGLVSYGGGNVELVDSTVSLHEFGQSGSGNGAGVAAAGGGTLTLRGVHVNGNRAWEYGGGLYVDPSSTARVYNSTFANNDASESGGAIFNAGSLSLTNTTLYDNEAFDEGGGIYNRSGATAVIRQSTITGNAARGTDQDYGGGIYTQAGGTLTLANSIVAGNYSEGSSATNDVGGPGVVTFDGVNVFATPGTGDAQDLIETNLANIFDTVTTHFPGFDVGALANNGGPLPTVLINPNGVAVDRADAAAIPADAADLDGDGDTAELLPIDARGAVRQFDLQTLSVGSAPDVGAVEIGPFQNLVVTTLDDEVWDAGTSNFLDGTGLSLREAIDLANRTPGTDSITFDQSIDGGTLTLENGQLSITDSVDIIGPGSHAPGLTIDGNNATRIFHIDDGDHSVMIPVSLSGLRLQNGFVVGRGGGIRTLENLSVSDSTITGSYAAGGGAISVGGPYFNTGNVGALTLTDSTLAGNEASGAGGGIFAVNSAQNVTIVDSTINGNQASQGGGMFLYAEHGAIDILGSTISGNVSTAGVGGNLAAGGGIGHYYGTLNVRNSTIAGNVSNSDHAGGIHSALYPITLENTIVANNSGGADIYGNVNSSYSLIENTGSATINDLGGTLTNVDPLLGPLQNNGGSTQTHELLAGSPALNAGDPNAVAGVGNTPLYDQRGAGFDRVKDFRLDMGAVEGEIAAPTSLVVGTNTDTIDGAFGPGQLSLREAVSWANTLPGADTITFDPSMAGTTIRLTQGELALSSDITIDGDTNGDGVADVTLSGDADASGTTSQGDSRHFFIDNNANVELRSLILERGYTDGALGPLPTDGFGGSIFAGAGTTLTVTESTLRDNAANGGLSGGGAISSGGNLSVTGSTLSRNSTDGAGGAAIVYGSGTVDFDNTTIDGNSAFAAAGIYASYIPNLTIQNSTITGNQATNHDGGGLYLNGTTAAVTNSTISYNFAQGDGSGILNRGTLSLTNSTVSDNLAAGSGGGIHNSGNLTAANTTVAANDAAALGGGILNSPIGDLAIFNSTVSGNANTIQAGLLNQGTLSMTNSIILGNSGANEFSSVATNYLGGNIVGDTFGIDGVSQQTGITPADVFAAIDPTTGGGMLADNGGQVQTIALKADAANVALDTGSGSLPSDTFDLDGDGDTAEPLPVDARGQNRAVDLPAVGTVAPDLGALEHQTSVLVGDFDNDGDLDGVDIDALIANIAVGPADTTTFDLNGDGMVDLADRDQWLALGGAMNLPSGNPYLLGDANLDGVVDGQDFIDWNNSKFTSTPAWTAGDFNADGVVDGQDFIIWNNHKFQSADVGHAVGRDAFARVTDFALANLFAEDEDENVAHVVSAK